MKLFLANFKLLTIIIFSCFYIGVGCAHFIFPERFLIIMPPYLPFHLELVYLSGILEIIFGLLLPFKRFRCLASWGLIILLIAVFPANIYLYISDFARESYGSISKKQALIRMCFQPCLIIIAYWHGRLTTNNNLSIFFLIISIITIIYFMWILF